MMQQLPRAGFHSPRFIRLLADLAIDGSTDGLDSKHSKQSFAERLGQWLDLTAAIALSGTLHAKPGSAPAASLHAGDALEEPLAPQLASQLTLLRGTLAESISADGVLRPGKVRIKLPAPTAAADFAPYRRYYMAHQRDMEAAIGPLRASVRKTLARRSPALKQLAELDAVLDKAMSERERNLLASVPQLIEKRFEQLRQAHRQAQAELQAELQGESPAELQQADDPAQWMQPGGWLARFCRDMQGVLLAELELRLQPLTGMVEAFSNEQQRDMAEKTKKAPLPPPAMATATPGGALFS